MPVMTGGVSRELKPADDEVTEICEKVRSEVEARAGRSYSEFTPIHYKTQLVNGVNYFVKVRVDANEHVHVRAHKSFQGEVTLAAHQDKKTLEDAIEYFQ